VFIKVAIVLLAIGFGFKYVNTANWEPFIPQRFCSDGSSCHGWQGIARRGCGILLLHRSDAVSTAAQEAKTPARYAHRHALPSLAICIAALR
jgi:APA family basic amino acid/polyamine antiporter